MVQDRLPEELPCCRAWENGVEGKASQEGTVRAKGQRPKET